MVSLIPTLYEGEGSLTSLIVLSSTLLRPSSSINLFNDVITWVHGLSYLHRCLISAEEMSLYLSNISFSVYSSLSCSWIQFLLTLDLCFFLLLLQIKVGQIRLFSLHDLVLFFCIYLRAERFSKMIQLGFFCNVYWIYFSMATTHELFCQFLQLLGHFLYHFLSILQVWAPFSASFCCFWTIFDTLKLLLLLLVAVFAIKCSFQQLVKLV